ncbi:MAG: hypothetical protein CMQ29_09290 [Gammaproteobacteria bacterium]|nr:hypothetical protein [Gammaproteobacteria bacterium]
MNPNSAGIGSAQRTEGSKRLMPRKYFEFVIRINVIGIFMWLACAPMRCRKLSGYERWRAWRHR